MPASPATWISLLSVARKHKLFVVEDAAQAIDSYYKGLPLGSLGDFGAFSFHETKNIISGEGGMLVVNDVNFIKRAEIIREKGTNRSAFFRGEVDKYGWVDIGSSFLPSDIVAAYLYAQLENMDSIQSRRKAIWQRYYSGLKHLEEKGQINLPVIPDYATNNGHMFYIICENMEVRTKLIDHLKKRNILAVFHYLPLHSSPYYSNRHDGRLLQNAKRYSDCLLRLPLYYELSENEQDMIIEAVNKYYR